MVAGGTMDRRLIEIDERRRAIKDLPEEQSAMAHCDRQVRPSHTPWALGRR
jgi:hypothetical protein